MGYLFKLERHTSDGYIGRYDEDALRAMESYLMRLPNALQRSDGSIVLVESAARRDEIVSAGRVDEWHHTAHIVLRSDAVSIDAEPNGAEIGELARFFTWSMAHWPATLCDEEAGLGIITVEQFLDNMDFNRRQR